MKVQLISFRYNLKSKTKNDLALSLINESNSDLLLFSGHTIDNIKDLLLIKNKISNRESIVFLELKEIGARNITNWSFKIENGQLLNCSTHQLFATSKEISNNSFVAESLYNEVLSKRIHHYKNKKICLLVCGELNILTNLQSKSNKVEFRVDDNELRKKYEELFNDVDIFLNPIHTPMGNQGKMLMRRKFLSKNHRAYFSTANLEKTKSESLQSFTKSRSLQYAYYNSKELISSNNYVSSNYLISEYII